ncbi:MAG: ATP-binding protein [Spirochaetia bacterium]
MFLAVASGKGGTGKTTVSLNLARVLGPEVVLADCDVEEPNCHLFLDGYPGKRSSVNIRIPEVDEDRCTSCGECGAFCQFNAIVSVKTKPLVFPELCHGCGGCTKVCPEGAVHETDREIGVVETIHTGDITLIQGRLNVGVAIAPPVVRAVKARLKKDGLTVLDAPPGTGCTVSVTIAGADYVVLVTEPTPFGLNDLKLSVEMVRELGIPAGVVINRSGIGDGRMVRYLESEGIPLLGEIPDDRRVAEAYSRGKLMTDEFPRYRRIFLELAGEIKKRTAL